MKDKQPSSNIVEHRKAHFEYALETVFEAGLVLEGWEVKSLRAGRVQIVDSYILVKRGEAYVIGLHIQPLPTASTHVVPVVDRTRKLLLQRREINQVMGLRDRKGYTLIPLRLYWKNNRVKLAFAVAKGKKVHDKRRDEKEKAWQKQKRVLLKKTAKGG